MHVVLLIIGIILIGALIFHRPGGSPFARPGKTAGADPGGPEASPEASDAEVRRLLEKNPKMGGSGLFSEERQREINEALAAKGKFPWMLREKGQAVLSSNAGLVRETFDPLDAYEAETSFDIRDEKPVFDDDYANQQGKADALSRALEQHLKEHLSFPFKALAGEGKVDVVTLRDYGNKAYVFIVSKSSDNFVMRIEGQNIFYFDVPRVLQTLEEFVAAHPRMDEVIWLERDTGFFMFVVQQRFL